MRIPRIYTPQPLAPGTTLSLETTASQHILKVLRLKPPQAILLFNNSPWDYPAILQPTPSGCVGAWVTVQTPVANQTESPLKTILIQGLSRAERMDWTLQKAVELGISEIIPVQTERSVVKLDTQRAQSRQQHWQQIIISACEQCGRSQLPVLHTVMPLWQGLQYSSALAAQRWLLDPQAAQSLAQITLVEPPSAITLLIGAEGGFSPLEQQQAQQCGFSGITLGPRILRTETAALAALAVIQQRWGDWIKMH